MIELPAVIACVRKANQNNEPKHVSRLKDQQLRVTVMVFVLAMHCKNQAQENLVASQIGWTARYLTHEQQLKERMQNVFENCSVLAHISTYHVQIITRLLMRSAGLF